MGMAIRNTTEEMQHTTPTSVTSVQGNHATVPPGRKYTTAEATEYLLRKNAELYRRLAQ